MSQADLSAPTYTHAYLRWALQGFFLKAFYTIACRAGLALGVTALPPTGKLIYISGSAVFDRRCSLTGMIDIRHQSARQ
jgi:hypothetical protein